MRASLNRRAWLASAGAVLVAGPASAAAPPLLTVWKTPTCGCCGAWVDHVRAAGFAVRVVMVDDLTPVRAAAGVPDDFASCHTGRVEGYAVEGHVPAADVRKLLRLRPKARGIAVPGMPLGSPGMEVPGRAPDRYATFLILPDGRAEVFSVHG